MSTRHVLALIVVFCTAGQLGCCCMNQFGCGCGMGGQVYDGCCASCGVADCASCGCPEASCCCPEPACCCPEPSCCCPDPACGCPDSCGGGVGCGSPVMGNCPLLQRIRRALHGCCNSGCGGRAYCSEWTDCPPCDCDPCDCYGNYIGGRYSSPHGQRARMARRNVAGELQFGESDNQPMYR